MTATATPQELRQLLRVLRRLYVWTGVIDNGTCVLCGGHRRWTTGPTGRGRMLPEPCSTPDCLSHEIEQLLRAGRRRRATPANRAPSLSHASGPHALCVELLPHTLS